MSFDRPVFVFTADQDWAPKWAIEIFLAELHRLQIPLHIFCTNPCTALARAVAKNEAQQGWHPNFLPGSTHGSSIAQVIDYFERNFPGATTVRSHCYSEDTFSWRALRAAGIVADSQLATRFQSHLQPLRHWTGMLRLPVYFEDDVFFDIEPNLNLDVIESTLFTPGLKILNFHPTFVACNTPSRDYHQQFKAQIFSPTSTPVRWEGRGTGTVMRELMERILSEGHRFQTFHSVVEMAQAALED